MIGSSAAFGEVIAQVREIARIPSTVLVTGESGTGKELVARAIHDLSDRKDAPFVGINCASLPTTLLESELFGHEKGAFTNAVSRKPGLFEEAQLGTIFLDEIGEMDMSMQAKLLRVLQERTIRRVGGLKDIPINVRVIAATNRNLHSKIIAGTFREDLFYRINVFPIHIPPLRERSADIPPLAAYFLDSFSRAFGRDFRDVSAAAAELMQRYAWPGNIRELRNVIERICIMQHGPTLLPEHLPPEIRGISPSSAMPVAAGASSPPLPVDLGLDEAVMEFEKAIIGQALAKTRGNVLQTAPSAQDPPRHLALQDGKIRALARPAEQARKSYPTKESDAMTDKYDVQPEQSIELLKELHILTRDGKLNQDSRRKLKQVYHLFQFIEPLLTALQQDHPDISLVDHGAGKSYLGFILYDLFFKKQESASRIFGIETRDELVAKSRSLADRLNFTGMTFLKLSVADSITSPALPPSVDLVTALHACDTATDDAIRFALEKRARFIVLVPCCQAEVAAVLRKNKAVALGRSSLSEIWRHPLHTREFGSHVTNVLRCLQLEAHGYQVNVTELVGWEHSMKNELIIASYKDLPRRRPTERLHDLLHSLGLEELSPRFFHANHLNSPCPCRLVAVIRH